MVRAATGAILLVCLASAAGVRSVEADVARKATAPNVTVELIAARPTLVPGENWLGLRFILNDGWYIYWVNPGDSGGPPTALWTPSAGLSAGEFEWGVPTRIAHGPLVNYGFYGDVVLPFRLTVARGTTEGRLGADVSWLVCKDICIAGKARLAIGFPLTGDARAATPDWARMIARAREGVPRPAPRTWRVEGREEGNAFHVTLVTGTPASGGTFFPMDAGVIEEAADQAPTPFDRGIRFTLRKSNLLTATPATLRGVVTLGPGPAHVVSVPIVPAAPTKGR